MTPPKSPPQLALRPQALATVLEVGRAVAEVAGMPELVALIVRKAAEVAAASRAAIAFVEDGDDRLTLRAWWGLDDEEAGTYRGRLGAGLLGRAAQSQQLLLRRDVPGPEQEGFLGDLDALAIPLLAEQRSKGVLLLARQEPFNAVDRQVLEALCAHFAASIDNVWLYDRYRALNAELEAKVEARTRELHQAQAQLLQREKMASLGQLTAGIAHEINNPLAFVSSNLDILEGKLERLERLQALERFATPSEPQECLAIIEEWKEHARFQEDAESFLATLPESPAAQLTEVKAFLDYVRRRDEKEEGALWQTVSDMRRFVSHSRAGVQRITSIVRDLRTFSRLDEAAFEEADLHEGLEQALTLLGHLFRGTDVRLVKRYELDARVPCHPARLNQVFMNLLVNAVQALGGRGEVRVSTRKQGDQAVIEVEDTGPGIPPELRGKIFEPFFTTKPIGEGTGLGLSLSYGIVTDHGGILEVEGGRQCGSLFRVRLPLARPALPREETPS